MNAHELAGDDLSQVGVNDVLEAARPPSTCSVQEGCWVAYYCDFSGFEVFGTEIDALRHAVGKSMSVRFLRWGQGRTELNAL